MSVETEATRWPSIHPSSNSGKASANEPNDSGNNKHRRTNQCEDRVETQIGKVEQATTPTVQATGPPAPCRSGSGEAAAPLGLQEAASWP